MIVRLIEVERLCEMETYMKKYYDTLKTTIRVQILVGQVQLKNLEPLNYMRSLTTNYKTCTREIVSKISMEKAAVNKRNGFTNRLD
jgi:hypothetical protein